MTYEKSGSNVIGALADPSRRDVLNLLRGGESPVGALADRLPISRRKPEER